jgi:hypothetical protein
MYDTSFGGGLVCCSKVISAQSYGQLFYITPGPRCELSLSELQCEPNGGSQGRPGYKYGISQDSVGGFAPVRKRVSKSEVAIYISQARLTLQSSLSHIHNPHTLFCFPCVTDWSSCSQITSSPLTPAFHPRPPQRSDRPDYAASSWPRSIEGLEPLTRCTDRSRLDIIGSAPRSR